jgi:Spy/CpxP family protein refolding chaperone
VTPYGKYIASAFCVGLFFGVALGRFSTRWFHRDWIMSEKSFSRKLDRFSARLDLTPEQKAEVAVLLKSKRDKVNALFSTMEPRLEEIRSSTAAEIRKLLAPEQQAKFDKLHAHHEAEWKKAPLYRLAHDRSSL